jgi:uncharacterized protein (TIGR02996 family)
MLEDAFLRDIRERPDDDTPRLVYADWLDDHGDSPCAEFIRTQIALAKLVPGDSRRDTLQQRQADLLAEHEEHWLSPLPADLYRWKFERGLLSAIIMRWAASLEPAGHLFDRHPIDQVGYVHIGAHIHELIATPFLERLRGLDLGHVTYPPPILHDLFASSRLAGLRRLTGLLIPQAGGALNFLTGLAIAPQLTELGADGLDDTEVIGLIEHPAFGGLDALLLDDEGLTETSLERVIGPERAGRWTKLSLGMDPLPDSIMGKLDRCSRLKELHLTWPAQLEPGAARLPAGVEHLNLHIIDGSGRFLPELSRQGCLEGLRGLAINVWNEETVAPDEDWEALAEVLRRLPGPVLELNLPMGPADGLARLVRLPALQNLAEVALREQVVSDEDLTRLCERDDLTGLRSLELHCESLTVDQVRRLANAPLLDRLQTLSLFQVRLPDEAVEALLASDRLRRLTSLNLGSTGIGGRAVAALADWPGLARLRRLLLFFNEIDAEGIRPLLRVSRLRSLTELQLEQNARSLRRPLRRTDVLPLVQRLGNRLSI